MPLDCEAPPPPNSGKLTPAFEDSVWKELPPREASWKAELKVASVDVSATAEACWASLSLKNSLSVTAEVSVRSKTAICCCSPGASGRE